jgi:hypothetical protein
MQYLIDLSSFFIINRQVVSVVEAELSLQHRTFRRKDEQGSLSTMDFRRDRPWHRHRHHPDRHISGQK